MANSYLKPSKGQIIFNFFNNIFLILLCIATVYPFLYVVIASFSDSDLLISHTGFLLKPVGEFTLSAYNAVLKNPNIINGYKNTLILIIVGTTSQVFMTAIGAYFFSRKDVMWKNALMFLIVFTMFFGGGMIPTYVMHKRIFFDQTQHLGMLFIPGLINPYNLIIMRTSFAGIPISLEESAKLDGAGHFTIFIRIILPLSKAVIAVMFLYYGVSLWNDWFWAPIWFRDKALFPLQVVLREILIDNGTEEMMIGADLTDRASIGETIKYATIVVAVIPVLVIYPFIQKYFTKGVMVGAIKG